MKRAFGIVFLFLLVTGPNDPRVNGEQSRPRGVTRSAADVAERGSVRIRLNLSLTPTDLGLSENPLAKVGIDAGAATRPLSRVRLLNNEHFIADWRGGRIDYRIEGFNPLGASVGGQLSTNTAKITFSWSSGN